MGIDLPSLLSKFRSFEDRENQVAWFRTLVPWVAPKAYLNIIYKPAPSALLDEVATRWSFPEAVVEFLRRHNGAKLFSGALSLYGVVAPGQLLNRQDRFSLPPFNIEQENASWSLDPDRLLVVGGYRLDGSRACIDRSDSHIHVLKTGQRNPIASWPSLENWLADEVLRLRSLFDDDGRRIGPKSDAGPPRPSGAGKR